MKTIEIRIPELGKATGTTAWVAPKLEHIANTLQLAETKQGEPCLTYEHWKNKDKDGNPKIHILCYIGQPQWAEGYTEAFGCYRVHAQYSEYGPEIGLFPILSEKANEVVIDFLNEICDKFSDEYNEH